MDYIKNPIGVRLQSEYQKLWPGRITAGSVPRYGRRSTLDTGPRAVSKRATKCRGLNRRLSRTFQCSSFFGFVMVFWLGFVGQNTGGTYIELEAPGAKHPTLRLGARRMCGLKAQWSCVCSCLWCACVYMMAMPHPNLKIMEGPNT